MIDWLRRMLGKSRHDAPDGEMTAARKEHEAALLRANRALAERRRIDREMHAAEVAVPRRSTPWT
jgi:hypothetical protein